MESFYFSSEISGLEVKCKSEMLLFLHSPLRGSCEGLLVDEMEKLDVGRLDLLGISNRNIYGRKKSKTTLVPFILFYVMLRLLVTLSNVYIVTERYALDSIDVSF